MEQVTTFKFLRQRKFLMVLLLIVPPFTAFLWWSFNSGKEYNSPQKPNQQGFNVALPDAYLKDDKSFDKMSYYNKAALDSAKFKELMRNDPYYNQQPVSVNEEYNTTRLAPNEVQDNKRTSGQNTSPYSRSSSMDANEEKVYRKLEQLNIELNKTPTMPHAKTDNYSPNARSANTPLKSADVDRMEKMMHAMNQKENDDPELRQLDNMLEKIMDIQHPDRVQEKVRQSLEERKGHVFAVSVKGEYNPIYLMENSGTNIINDTVHSFVNQGNGFYAYDGVSYPEANAIEAVIHETQTLVSGSVVKLRLTNDVYVNGVLIPKDNFFFGTASLSSERLSIRINSIRYGNTLLPVELAVYDLDGMAGIYIPGAITRDVAKQSADRAIQDVGITSLSSSLGVQAASAGIEATKSLLSKKVKLIKVTIKAGYRVLLRDEQQK